MNAVAQCAFKSPTKTGEVVITRATAVLSETPASYSVTAKLFVDRRASAQQSVALYPSAQRTTWGAAWGLRWAEAEARAVEFGIRAGTRCEQISIRLESNRPFRVERLEVFGRALSPRVRGG